MIIADLPYGSVSSREHSFGIQDWDVAPTGDQLLAVFRGIKYINSAKAFSIILWHHEDTLPLIKKASLAEGFDWRNWGVGIQDGKQDAGGFHIVQATQMWSFVTFGPISQLAWNTDKNPSHPTRVNWIKHSGPTQLLKDEHGDVVNPCQKPLSLEKHFIGIFTKSNDWVLSLYSGTGSTSAACLISERNCISVDIRQDQVKNSYLRVSTLNECINNNVNVDDDGFTFVGRRKNIDNVSDKVNAEKSNAGAEPDAVDQVVENPVDAMNEQVCVKCKLRSDEECYKCKMCASEFCSDLPCFTAGDSCPTDALLYCSDICRANDIDVQPEQNVNTQEPN